MKIADIYEHPLPMKDERLALLAARIPVLLDWLQRENDEVLRRAIKVALLRALEVIEDELPDKREWCNAVRRLT